MADPAQAQAVLRPTSADVAAQLGKPAQLEAKRLNMSGDWAFLYARITGPGGALVDYTGTKFEGQQRSSIYAGLLRGGEGRWELVASSIGPTDVAWWDWGAAHAAPEELFTISDS